MLPLIFNNTLQQSSPDEDPMELEEEFPDFMEIEQEAEKASILASSPEEIRSSPALMSLFKKILNSSSLEPEHAANLSEKALRILEPNELPHWVKPSPLQLVLLGRTEEIKNFGSMPPEFWLSMRDSHGNSLLHLAVQREDFQMASELVKLCPAFTMAVNCENKHALDYLYPQKHKIEHVLAILQHYEAAPVQSENDCTPLWRRLAALCRLENPHWACELAKKINAKELNFQGILKDPIEFHPLNLCFALNKGPLATKLLSTFSHVSRTDILFVACSAGAKPVAASLLHHSCRDIRAHGEMMKLQWKDLMDIYMEGMTPANRALLSLFACPEHDDSKQLWKSLKEDEVDSAISKLLSIPKYQKDLSHKKVLNTSYFLESLNQSLVRKKDNIEYLNLLLKWLPAIHSKEFASKVLQLASLHEAPIAWLTLAATLFLTSDEDLEHLRWLFKRAQETCDISLDGAEGNVLRTLMDSHDVEIEKFITLLLEECPKKLKRVAETRGLEIVSTLFEMHKARSEEALAKTETLMRLLQDSPRSRQELRGRILLSAPEKYLRDAFSRSLLPPDWQTEEIVGVFKQFSPLVISQPHSLEALMALMRKNGEARLFDKKSLHQLIDKVFDAIAGEESLCLLDKLEGLFSVHPEKGREALSSYLLENGLYTRYLPLHKLQWLAKNQVPFPSPEEGERSLAKLGTTLKFNPGYKATVGDAVLWWLRHVSQGMNCTDYKPGICEENVIDSFYLAFQKFGAETLAALGTDKRFRKRGKNYHFTLAEQEYVLRPTIAGALEIFRKTRETKEHVHTGFYTKDRLLNVLRNDAESRQNLLTGPWNQYFPKKYLDRPVPGQFNAAAIVESGTREISICFRDLATGTPSQKNYPRTKESVGRILEFIRRHENEFQARIDALKEIPETDVIVASSDSVHYAGNPKIIVSPEDLKTLIICPVDGSSSSLSSFTQEISGIPSRDEASRCLLILKAVKALSEKFGIFYYRLPSTTNSFIGLLSLFGISSMPCLRLAERGQQLLVSTNDFVIDRLFMLPCTVGEVEQTGRNLRLYGDLLSGWMINQERIKGFHLDEGRDLIHDAPAVVIQLSRLTDMLAGLSDSKLMKEFLARHEDTSFESMQANLRRFLEGLAHSNIPGFLPREEYEKVYQRLRIQLSHILKQLGENEDQRELQRFVCELSYITSYCGPQIADHINVQYKIIFGLFNHTEERGSVFSLLKEAYRKAALEVLDTMLKWTIDKEAGKQTVHVLSYLRNTLEEHGYPLPPDPQLIGTKESFSNLFGPKDFPKDHLPFIFEGMMLPQLASKLEEIQARAAQNRDGSVLSLFMEGIAEAVLSLLPFKEEFIGEMEAISKIESERRRTLEHLRHEVEELRMGREEAAQKYRKESEELQHIEHLLRGLHDKVKALHERLRQLYDEKESLDGETETVTPGKRSFSQLLSFHSQWVSNAALKKARIAEVEKEIKTLVYSCDESRKVIHLLERRLEAAKRGPMHPIFELDAQIAAKLSLVDDHSKKYKGMIEEIIQNVAISKLGAVAYDENDVPYVTKKGIVALLSHHKLITESKELKHQMEQFFFSRP